MAPPSTMPDIEKLDLSDSDPHYLFASPSQQDKKSALNRKDKETELSNDQSTHKARNGESRYDSEEAREASLRNELESVRSINQVMEGVIESLERAKGNMENVSRTVNSASTLLNTWTRILSQTEHNQRLIMNPSWHGASQDVADMESESILKQQAAERKEIEDAQRREAAARKAEEEERRRTEGNVTRGLRGPRGRGRGSGRGITRASPGYSGVGGQGGRGGIGRSSSIGQTRAGSGIGRGIPGARARGRGVP